MTNIFEILLIGFVLCADSFSAALAMGSRPHTLSDRLKFAISSSGAEVLCTFIGAIAGLKIISQLDSIDHWISFLLLIGVAIHMFYEGLCAFKEGVKHLEFYSFTKLLIVSFATSFDALAVGVGLGAAQKPLIPFLLSIGIWAFLSTIIGMQIGKIASKKWGAIFSLIGAFILLTLAIKFLIDGL